MFLHSGGFDLVQDLWDRRQIGDFVIVSPAGYASFFMNSHDGRFRYDDFFLQEFIPLDREPLPHCRAARIAGIGGISMGGYGALRMAFLHPQMFASVSAHSAALMERLPVSLGERFPGIRTAAPAGGCLRRRPRSRVLGPQ